MNNDVDYVGICGGGLWVAPQTQQHDIARFVRVERRFCVRAQDHLGRRRHLLMFGRTHWKDVLNQTTTLFAVVSNGSANVVRKLHECARRRWAGVVFRINRKRCRWHEPSEVVRNQRDGTSRSWLRSHGGRKDRHALSVATKPL